MYFVKHLLIPLVSHAFRRSCSKSSTATRPPIYDVTLMRHGECELECARAYSGWYDSKLTPQGVDQAKEAGLMLESEGMNYHIAYTSELDRAQHTVRLLLDSLLVQPRVFATWRLNDRHYGDLTGYNKNQMALVHGEEDLAQWVERYDGAPPPIKETNPIYADVIECANRKNLSDKLPESESQQMVDDRVTPYWDEIIVPSIKMHNKVMVVAHLATLRAILKRFADLTAKESMSVDIPSGIPFTFALDSEMQITKSKKSIVFGGGNFGGSKSLNRNDNKNDAGDAERHQEKLY